MNPKISHSLGVKATGLLRDDVLSSRASCFNPGKVSGLGTIAWVLEMRRSGTGDVGRGPGGWGEKGKKEGCIELSPVLFSFAEREGQSRLVAAHSGGRKGR